MVKLKHIAIYKLWGYKNIVLPLYDDINIIIGPNGSNKTILLTLLDCAINLNLKKLCEFEFESIHLNFDSEVLDKIYIRKNGDIDHVVFTISLNEGESIQVDFFKLQDDDYSYKNSRSYEELRTYINELVNFDFISVSRQLIPKHTAYKRFQYSYNPVDWKLKDLMYQLVMYQLQLSKSLELESQELHKKMCNLLLYNSDYDKIAGNASKTAKFTTYTEDDLSTQLFQVFGEIGLANDKKKEIKEHIRRLSDVIEKLQHEKELSMEDVLPLALVARTVELIQISKEFQIRKKGITELIDKYKQQVNSFLKDKKISFTESKDGVIFKTQHNNKLINIEVKDLSSGEKQLLILLTQMVLQQNNPYILVVDEPELSLHIEWQRKIVKSLNVLNPSAQIIIATHAPEIAGSYPSKVKNLLNCTEYVE